MATTKKAIAEAEQAAEIKEATAVPTYTATLTPGLQPAEHIRSPEHSAPS